MRCPGSEVRRFAATSAEARSRPFQSYINGELSEPLSPTNSSGRVSSMTYFHAILQAVLFCAVLAAVVWMFWLALEQSTEKEKKSWSSVVKGLLLGTAAGTCVGLGGFFLANAPATHGMGEVMFMLVPFCAGFAIAMVTRGRNTAWACSLLAAL